MNLTETEKDTLEFVLENFNTSRFDWDDSVSVYASLENEYDPGVLKRRLKRLAKKGILESVENSQLGVTLKFTYKKVLLAYNGIFTDTLTDHLGEEYSLDIVAPTN